MPSSRRRRLLVTSASRRVHARPLSSLPEISYQERYMKRSWLAVLAILLAGGLARTISADNPGVTLIGTGVIPGDALDKSGLAGRPICQRDDSTVCIDQATLGGLGSAVTYTGFNNVFL